MVLQSLPNLQNRIQQHFRNSNMWLCYFTAQAYVTSLFLKYVFKNFQTNILVTLLTLYQYNRFKLPLALIDDTGSIEAIAFSSIAEDLVERNAYQASQNMKIHATDHAASLQTAVGKIRLFHIGMSTDMSSNFSIKYVIRKSFPIANHPQCYFCHIMRLANYSECIMLYLLPYLMENMCFQNTPASPILPLPATNDTSSVTRFFLIITI